MLVSEFDFELPPELIAQQPAEPRDSSRLLHMQARDGAMVHRSFADFPELLRPDDLLVVNDTRVIRARLRGRKLGPTNSSSQPGAAIEALLLREHEPNVWECLLRPSARLKVGTRVVFASADGNTIAYAKPLARVGAGWLVRFESDKFADVRAVLPQLGEVPLPPYISKLPSDESQYQTVYARQRGADQAHAFESAAAPTAGLHFTAEVMQRIRERGVRTERVTLGIGAGTFMPLRSPTVEEHVMHSEEYEITEAAAAAINEQKLRGRRVVAVGTTSVRVLESACDEGGQVRPGRGSTSLYLRPGHRFSVINALLTNFHLPRSSLLVMIAAFLQHAASEYPVVAPDELAGVRRIRYAYSEAIRKRYRFFSFGDAMFIE